MQLKMQQFCLQQKFFETTMQQESFQPYCNKKMQYCHFCNIDQNATGFLFQKEFQWMEYPEE